MQGTSSRNVGRDAINAFNEIVRGGLINLFPCARHKSWGLPPSLLDYTEGGGRGEGGKIGQESNFPAIYSGL